MAPRARSCRASWPAALRAQANSSAVSNGEAASEDRDREFVFEHRYQLSAP